MLGLLSLEILSDLKSCNSPESAALEGIFNAGGGALMKENNYTQIQLGLVSFHRA